MNIYNAQSIQLWIADKRSGKTLGMTAENYEKIVKINPDIKVYANYELNKKYFPNYIRIKTEHLRNLFLEEREFKNCLFLIDEIHLVLDSRNFGKKGQKDITYSLGQMGKRGNILVGNTHFPRLVDIRLRSYCERWVFVKKGLMDETFGFKEILNYNRELSKEENNILTFLCEPVIRKLDRYNFIYIDEAPFYIKANKYFDFYDTEEFIKPE